MDSASPDAVRVAGQPTVTSGLATFFAFGTDKAEPAFAFDWLDARTADTGSAPVRSRGARHRGAHRLPAQGYGRAG